MDGIGAKPFNEINFGLSNSITNKCHKSSSLSIGSSLVSYIIKNQYGKIIGFQLLNTNFANEKQEPKQINATVLVGGNKQIDIKVPYDNHEELKNHSKASSLLEHVYVNPLKP
ncbi:MAG: hypothetical protein MK033_08865 [Candidatus Caenarcaniphilales bacterium]|nr:hypothetical protein [Candidatus Caenarcaniphilales bacterium]